MKVYKEFTLCASHIVPNHPGKCARLHGHNWKITVSVYGGVSPSTGMVLDFNDLKRAVSPIIERLDHQHLNFYLRNPTAENLALYIARELVTVLGSTISVQINETDKTEAAFVGPDDFQFLSTQDGWKEPFEKFVAFKCRKAMYRWIHWHERELKRLQEAMTEVGARLASFEMYKASLDEYEASRLLVELRAYKETAVEPGPPEQSSPEEYDVDRKDE